MTSFAVYGVALTVLSGIGAWLLGRLTVRLNGLQSLALKIPLYFGVALMSSCIAIAPIIFLVFQFSDLLGSQALHSLTSLQELLLSVSYLVYYAVLYLAFRLGTERVHGTG